MLQFLGNLLVPPATIMSSDAAASEFRTVCNELVTEELLRLVLGLTLYRRPNLTETSLWVLNTILDIDKPSGGKILSYLQATPNFFLALKTTLDGFKSKPLDLKLELIALINTIDI